MVRGTTVELLRAYGKSVPPDMQRILARMKTGCGRAVWRSIFQSKNDTEIDFRFQRKVILKRQRRMNGYRPFSCLSGGTPEGLVWRFGRGTRSRRRERPRGSVGNRSLVFHALPRGDAWRWECGNLAALARFPRGGGRGGNLFVVFHAFHRPVISTALVRRRHRNRGGTRDSVLQSRNNFALVVVIFRAHSVSLICIARCSKSAKLMFFFKCFAASGMACSFSYGVR